jgi:hypothetical protein
MLLASEDLLQIITKKWLRLIQDGEKPDLKFWLSLAISSLDQKVDHLKRSTNV